MKNLAKNLRQLAKKSRKTVAMRDEQQREREYQKRVQEAEERKIRNEKIIDKLEKIIIRKAESTAKEAKRCFFITYSDFSELDELCTYKKHWFYDHRKSYSFSYLGHRIAARLKRQGFKVKIKASVDVDYNYTPTIRIKF